MTRQVLREEILKVWEVSSTKDELNAYMNIVDHILEQPYKNLTHLVFGSFIRVVDNPNVSRNKLLNFIFYLINKAELLDLAYEFIDDDSSYPVSLEEVKHAEETGFFYHPVTECPLKNYKDLVFMYFTPSIKLKRLKGAIGV